MNAVDILKYGQRTLIHTVERFPESQVEAPGACGIWSVKEIIAHLASHELIMVDVLSTFTTSRSTPYLNKFLEHGGQVFNETEVAVRKRKTMQEVRDELDDAHRQALALAAKISPEIFQKYGTIPWYGAEYCLDDLIVFASYGHKREHSAQIAAFGDPTTHRPDFQTTRTIEVTQQMEKAINQRDIERLMALYTPDCVFENTSPAPDGRRYEGQAAIRAFWEEYFRSDQHTRFQTEDLFAYDDHCLVRWKSEWGNQPGASQHVRGIDLIVLRDGKVAENFSYVKG